MRSWLPPTVLLGTVVVFAGALLAVSYQSNAELGRQLRGARADATGKASENRALSTDNRGLRDQVSSLIDRNTQLQSQNRQLQDQAARPTLGIWNVPQDIPSANDYLDGGVPDTFTYHAKLTSTGPMSVVIMTFSQYADAIQCVRRAGGNTHYCMHHSGGQNWAEITSVNIEFHDAEGCAGYVMVITAGSKVTITPDVSVTYNPAPHATGACA